MLGWSGISSDDQDGHLYGYNRHQVDPNCCRDSWDGNQDVYQDGQDVNEDGQISLQVGPNGQ